MEIDRAFEAAHSLHRAGLLTEARAAYRAILDQDSDHAGALHLLGVVELQLGNANEARRLIERALDLKPDFASGYSNLGNALRAQGYLSAAEEAYLKAVDLNPDLTVGHVNLAAALLDLGRIDDAIDAAHRAVGLEPENVDALVRLGSALGSAGRADEAGEAFQSALHLDPENAVAHGNFGNFCLGRQDLEGAVAACGRALELAPNFAGARGNLANAYRDQGRISEALVQYRRALDTPVDEPAVHSNLMCCMHYDPQSTAADILAESRCWARKYRVDDVTNTGVHGGDTDAARPLTVGYVSPDFRAHSVAFFFAGLLNAHDRAGFRINCYAEVARPDVVTGELRALSDNWVSTVGKSDTEVAARIREDNVDILVDLAGHTGGNRLRVFGARAAPVQVSWLGYPGTSGVPEIGYRLTDWVADPKGADGDYTETLIRLPNGFLCYRPPADAPEPVWAGAGVGQPGALTFGCFNTLAKVSEQVVATWADILRSAPGSRLVVKCRALADGGARRRALDLFAGHGVEPGRIDLRPWNRSIAEHLSEYRGIDVALDTFPYNGTTTTLEALWMGVPVVTLSGDRHAARVGASILTRLGLEQWIAESPRDYADKALGVAADVDGRRLLRGSLRERMARSPLCDQHGFARDVEAAYRDMWRRWCQGPKPL